MKESSSDLFTDLDCLIWDEIHYGGFPAWEHEYL